MSGASDATSFDHHWQVVTLQTPLHPRCLQKSPICTYIHSSFVCSAARWGLEEQGPCGLPLQHGLVLSRHKAVSVATLVGSPVEVTGQAGRDSQWEGARTWIELDNRGS